MACGKYNFTIYQGATLDLPIIYTDSNNVGFDLTEYGAKMQFRNAPSESATELYLTLSSSLNSDGTGLNFSGSIKTGFVSPVSGNIGIYISALTSSLLNFTTAEYDLFLFSGSYAELLLQGKVTNDKRVTS